MNVKSIPMQLFYYKEGIKASFLINLIKTPNPTNNIFILIKLLIFKNFI